MNRLFLRTLILVSTLLCTTTDGLLHQWQTQFHLYPTCAFSANDRIRVTPNCPLLFKHTATSKSTITTRLFNDLWDRMEIAEDEEPNWYLLNCVAGLEMDLLQQCRYQCVGFLDVVKFVVPTVTTTRSHGAKRMVRDTKVKYKGYVFAKLRLTRDTYSAIQGLDLCRSWMGTINMKGYKKLPPAPIPLTEEEIENFDLENPQWEHSEPEIVSTSPMKEKDRAIIHDTEEYEETESRILNEIEEAVQNVYNGLKVEDMVKVTTQNNFFNEDGIVRRLKESRILVRFFTYGTVFDEWLDPSDVRKLTEVEILNGLGGPSTPITQRDLDVSWQDPRKDNKGNNRTNDLDRRNQVGSFGAGPRGRRQDRTEQLFRSDRTSDNGTERSNWNWYKQNERRSQEGGYLDGKHHIRGSADYGKSPHNFWAEGDVDSQWGRRNDSPSTKQQNQYSRRQPYDEKRRQSTEDSWSTTSKSSASQTRDGRSKEETDNFFAALMSDLSSDIQSTRSKKDMRQFDDIPRSKGSSDDDDFFASLLSELSSSEETKPSTRSHSDQTTNDGNDDNFDDLFDSLEKGVRGSTRMNKSQRNFNQIQSDAEKQLDDVFAELSMNRDDRSVTPSSSLGDDDDFFASLEKELASHREQNKNQDSRSRRHQPSTDSFHGNSDDEDFFLALEAELDSDFNRPKEDGENVGTVVSDIDNFFSALDAEICGKSEREASSNSKLIAETSNRETQTNSGSTTDPLQTALPVVVSNSMEYHQYTSNESHVSTLHKRTVPELKDMLRDRGLKVSGKKSELIERLKSTLLPRTTGSS